MRMFVGRAQWNWFRMPYRYTIVGGMLRCLECGGSFKKPTGGYPAPTDDLLIQHTQYHDSVIKREDVTVMSAVLWCDRGDHPFKARTPGSSKIRASLASEDGYMEEVVQDVCPEHNPYYAPKTPLALNARPETEAE